MVRNLAAQAEAIWPQEKALVRALSPSCRRERAGCRLRHRRNYTAAGADAVAGARARRRHHRRPSRHGPREMRAARRARALREPQHLRSRPSRRALRSRRVPPRASGDSARRSGDCRARARHETRRMAAPDRRGLSDDQLRAASARPGRFLAAKARADSAAPPAPTCESAARPTAFCGGSGSRISAWTTSSSIRCGCRARHLRQSGRRGATGTPMRCQPTRPSRARCSSRTSKT